MKAEPAVSLLMSVRNGVPYIHEAVASIVGQTFTDWEFVIVDNASTDGAAAVMEELAAREPRIRFFPNAEDLGHSGGLNRGLEVCRGHWVARMDGDDVALPERLERQLEFLRRNPDVSVSSCLAYFIDERGQTGGKTASEPSTREAFHRYMAENLLFGLLHPGAIMRRDLLVQVGGYRAEFGPANDIDLWVRLAEAGGFILVQQEYLMKYRVHKDSISMQQFELARFKYQWARECMLARRRSAPEPSWEEFMAARDHAPWWQRLNRWRKITAKRLYRRSGQEFISDHLVRAAVQMGLATLLQPGYTIPRVRAQRRST